MSSTRISELSARYDVLLAGKGGRPDVVKEKPGFVPVPTAVHRALAGMLERLLELGLSTSSQANTSAHVRALLRTLHSLQPMLVEELAAVPEIRVRLFLTELRDSFDRVLSAPSGTADPGPGDRAREALTP